MRFLFLIQGEGRGHLTQALSFAALLKKEQHELVGVVVGKNPRRQVPDFFLQKIGVAVTPVESPTLKPTGWKRKSYLERPFEKIWGEQPPIGLACKKSMH